MGISTMALAFFDHALFPSVRSLQRSEAWRDADGQFVSRTHRAIGDKVVEETDNNGETTRTLRNIDESEVAAFDQEVAKHKLSLDAPWANQQPHKKVEQETLPALMEKHLANLKAARSA